MGKAEERCRVDKPGLLPESISEYGLKYARGCLQKWMVAGFFAIFKQNIQKFIKRLEMIYK